MHPSRTCTHEIPTPTKGTTEYRSGIVRGARHRDPQARLQRLRRKMSDVYTEAQQLYTKLLADKEQWFADSAQADVSQLNHKSDEEMLRLLRELRHFLPAAC